MRHKVFMYFKAVQKKKPCKSFDLKGLPLFLAFFANFEKFLF